jgi:hypothetical protein
MRCCYFERFYNVVILVILADYQPVTVLLQAEYVLFLRLFMGKYPAGKNRAF